MTAGRETCLPRLRAEGYAYLAINLRLGKIMVRFVLVAYLSLTVSCGPALCCCTAQQLFPFASATGCCGASETDHPSHSHAGHSHHHHGADTLAEYSGASNQASPEHRTPCEHDQKDCPCGRHQLTMFASQPDSEITVKSIALDHAAWLLTIDISISHLPEFEPHSLLAAPQHRCGDLSSREILRAHHRLQC